MSDSIEVTGIIPTSPSVLFRAFLDGRAHTAMTGGRASVQGERFTAWDGYITGQTIGVEEPRRIVQQWRTSEFPEGAEHSRLEILLEPAPDGTKVTFRHSNIPAGQGVKYENGWVEHYLDPMKKHFG